MEQKPKSPSEEATLIKNPNEFDKTNRYLLQDPQIYPILEIISGPKQGAWFSLARQKEVTLGRANFNKVILEDNSVSRSHATIHQEDGKYYIKDVGSRNGTAVNNKKVQENFLLKQRDSIKIGIYELKFLTEMEKEIPLEEEEEIQKIPPETFEEKTLLNQESALQAADQASLASIPSPSKETKEKLSLSVLSASSKKSEYQKMLYGIAVILITLLGLSIIFYKIFHKKEEVVVKSLPPTQPRVISPQIPTTQPSGTNQADSSQAGTVPLFLDVDAQPLQAKIFYRGKELGITPFKINERVPLDQPQELLAIYHFEELNLDFSEKKNFTVSKQDEVVNVRFEGSIASLKMKSLPKSVQVYLEGTFPSAQLKSQTAKLRDIVYARPIYLPYGNYVLEMKQAEKLEGGDTVVDVVKYRREFTLTKENPVYEVALSDQDLLIFPAKIKTNALEAEVILDGKKQGETPFEGNLPLGKHQLVIRKEGFFDHQQPLAMTMNTPFSAEITLKTSEAGQYINKGRELMRQGQYQQAIEQLAESLNHHPVSLEVAQVQILLGDCYIKTEAYDLAISYFEKAESQEKYKEQAALGIAESNFYLGNKDVALAGVVDLMLNAKNDKVQSNAETFFHKISPLKSVILVSTEPPGAKISLNGREIAQVTPVLLSALSLGSYRVLIEKDGYKSYETKVQLILSSFKPLLVKLEPLR